MSETQDPDELRMWVVLAVFLFMVALLFAGCRDETEEPKLVPVPDPLFQNSVTAHQDPKG